MGKININNDITKEVKSRQYRRNEVKAKWFKSDTKNNSRQENVCVEQEQRRNVSNEKQTNITGKKTSFEYNKALKDTSKNLLAIIYRNRKTKEMKKNKRKIEK